MPWEIINDDDIQHVWKIACDCNDEAEEGDEKEDETVTVPPSFYEENGQPSCQFCGTVYNYSHTEINKD